MKDDDLQRFVDAQNPVYDQVRAELRAGRKRTHWMWFVFFQLVGLGRSAMAKRYGIANAAEAEAYLAHDVLGTRLRDCTQLVLAARGRSITDIFGAIDAMKFRSSMTLFAQADADDGADFRAALRMYFDGTEDEMTLHLLERV